VDIQLSCRRLPREQSHRKRRVAAGNAIGNRSVHILRVGLIGDGKSVETAFRPDLPDTVKRFILLRFEKDGAVTVFVPEATDAEVAMIVSKPGAEIVQKLGTALEGKVIIGLKADDYAAFLPA
jgi:hypothetical protein